jgi:PTH1 family peptidyl-tRNA hydrolase
MGDMPDHEPIRAIFGLGNPGLAYRKNRHNAGFLFLDYLLEHPDTRVLGKNRRHQAILHEVALFGRPVLLVQPQTFMNLSGRSYAGVMANRNWTPAQTLLVYDDLDLPFASFRLRRGGSAGGHKGVLSILQQAGTREIPRIRIGIQGDEPYDDAADYVLTDFRPAELSRLTELWGKVYKALESVLLAGIDEAMNLYNRRGEGGPGPAEARRG